MGCLSPLELPVFASVEEETVSTKAQGWHGLGGAALQIYSTPTPQTPRQPQLPETVALGPTPAPAPLPSPPPSLQRSGLDGILNPPLPGPSSALPANASGSWHVSTPLSCCQTGQGEHEVSARMVPHRQR